MNSRNKNVDIFRAVSLVLVMIYHGWVLTGAQPFKYALVTLLISLGGEIGVTSFFALSGYGIYCSLRRNEEIEGKINYIEYGKKRMHRIIPQYVLCIVVVVLLSLPVYLSIDGVENIVTHLLFIHNWFPKYHGSINGVFWTMGVMVQFYIVAPVLYKGIKKYGLKMHVLCVIGTILMKYMMYQYILPYAGRTDLAFFGGRQLITALDNFLIGMLVAYLIQEKKMNLNGEAAILGCLFAAIEVVCVCQLGVIYGIHTNNMSGYIWHSLLALGIGVIMLSISYIRCNENNIICKMFLWLSKYEYGIYIWHMLILNKMLTDIPQIQLMINSKLGWLVQLIYLAIAIIVGAGISIVWEKKLVIKCLVVEIVRKLKAKIHSIGYWLLVLVVCVVATVINSVTEWYNTRFGVGLEEVLYTIMSPLNGSDTSFLNEAVEYVFSNMLAIPTMVVMCVVVGTLIGKVAVKNIDVQIWKWHIKSEPYRIYRRGCLIGSLVLFFVSIYQGLDSLDMGTYVARKIIKTKIYEDYYVKPTQEIISLNGEPKNIIYIYMESMETTYASKKDGGEQEVNYIPHLTELAKENISFSDTRKLGGAHVTSGTGWTMGALFATTTGVPFAFPIEGNSMGKMETFASGVTSLGDILEWYGYHQVFLCGSDATFAGRAAYFQQHGNYEIMDYYYAVEQGYIPAGYTVWWGYEDYRLYEIAKAELLKLAEEDIPFNFTMLTVDTHHVDGYICEHCNSTYDEQLANVLECADSMLGDFIAWCEKQSFYKDTVIVISGDHYRMDTSLVEDKERRLYNCIVNSDTTVAGSTRNRTFTSLDLFATTLSAMGFEIEGDRLGLSTDLFSDRKTLAEEIGIEELDDELGKNSDFYLEEFQ